MEYKFQVGDRVRVIDSHPNYGIVMGLEGVVVEIGGTNHIRIDSKPEWFWKPSRFELVETGVEFKVGDRVRIVKKAQSPNCSWVKSMDKFLNDGKEYVVTGYTGNRNVRLEGTDGYVFLPESLELVKAGKKIKPKKPRKPKKLPNKSLRAELIKAIKARYPAGAYTGLCSYATKMEDNAIITQIGQPCHASIGFAFDRDKKVKELAYSIHHELVRFNIKATKPSIRAYKKYLHYMLNESPWAPCFLTKSVPVALRYDVLMDVSRPKNEIAGACIALREGTEYHDKRYIFEKVLNKGFSGHTAYLMSFVFDRDGKKGFQLLNLNRGHCALSGSFVLKELIKFFKEGYFKTKDKKPYSEDHYGYEVHRAIADFSHKDDAFEDFIRPLLKPSYKGNGWDAKASYSEENLFQVAEAIEQLFKERA